MARPIKNGCDWFSHDSGMRNHRKVKALRGKFQNGYAIWCMLLEYMTAAEGNSIEFSEIELELLAGDFGFQSSEIREVINYSLLIGLLFNENGLIYSQTMKERLKGVYEKRNRQRGKSEQQPRSNGKFADDNSLKNELSPSEKSYSIVENSIVKNNTKKREKKAIPKKKRVREPVSPLLIQWAFDSDQFKSTYMLWLQHLRDKGKEATEATIIAQMQFLKKYDEETAKAIIQKSLNGGWTELYEPKIKNEAGKFNNKTGDQQPAGTSAKRVSTARYW